MRKSLEILVRGDVSLIDGQQPSLVVTIERLEGTVVAGGVVEWRHVLLGSADRLRQLDDLAQVVVNLGEAVKHPDSKKRKTLHESDTKTNASLLTKTKLQQPRYEQ